jgi:DNA-3-methyladenine glycosylase
MKSSAASFRALERQPVPTAFFRRPAAVVGPELVGLGLEVRHGEERLLARIVETEAYPPGDPAAHTFRGKNARNQSMYLAGGHAYVYRSHGIHACFNVVTGFEDDGQGVLIRAAEPLEGLAWIEARRPGHPLRDWLRGPGRLCQGLGIGFDDDGTPLQNGRLRLVRLALPPLSVSVSGRIGISRAADAPLRFFATGSPFVSGRGGAAALAPSSRRGARGSGRA